MTAEKLLTPEKLPKDYQTKWSLSYIYQTKWSLSYIRLHINYAHLASVRSDHSVCRGSLMTTFIYIYIYIYIYEFIFVIIESKHIYYSLNMTHKITNVLLRIIRLKTLTPDLLNWLYYPEEILPFSQVNYVSQCRVEKT